MSDSQSNNNSESAGDNDAPISANASNASNQSAFDDATNAMMANASFGNRGGSNAGGDSSSSLPGGPTPDEEPACETSDGPDSCCETCGGDADAQGGGTQCSSGTCGTSTNATNCSGGTCPAPTECSTEPIRFFNGEVRYSVNDLASGSGSLVHRRSYSNQMSRRNDYGNGTDWVINQWEYLSENADGSISLVRGPGKNLFFEADGIDTYKGRFGAKSTMHHAASDGLLIVTSPDGEQSAFHDFDQFLYPPGLLAWHKDAGGQLTEVVAYTDQDRIAEIQRSVQQNGQDVIEAFAYQYFDTPEQSGRLQYITLRRKVGVNDWQDQKRVEYDYYGPDDSNGNLGDLRCVRKQELDDNSAWHDEAVRHYRYYTSQTNKGFKHGLKFVLEPESYDRLAQIDDPLTVDDVQISQYADYYFQYDSDRRVSKEIVRAGAMAFQFEYFKNAGVANSGNPPQYNDWARKTIETRPDGSQNVVYTNHIGQVLVKEFRSEAGPSADRWIQAMQYNNDGRLVQNAQPSAVVDYNDSADDLAVAYKPNDGLINLTEYYADNVSIGAAEGYVKAKKVKRGAAGVAVMQQSYQYASYTAAGMTVRPISQRSEYRNDDGSGEVITTFDRQYHPGTVAVAQLTTTLPAVSAAQNGSASIDQRIERFDIHGNRTWARDERGTITHMAYDLASGVMAQQIEDVDTNQISGAPVGWTTPTGGGLHLVTDYQYDHQGRMIESLGPEHAAEVDGVTRQVRRASWIVYPSAGHQQWSGQGFRDVVAGTDTLVGPVSIHIRNRKGHPVQQISAVRPSSAGKLSASDVFTQSDYVRWTTFQYSDCCTLISQRLYHTIPASGEGAASVNYDETQLGYDSLKRRNRVFAPGGAITLSVFDVRDNVIATYSGTDDSGATVSNPTGNGTAGNDMTLMAEQQYDSGSDGGDGLLTRSIQHVDSVTTRVTDYTYDWRNRRTVVDGELDFYQVDTHDNMNRVVMTERYDTNASGNLASRTANEFDDRGRMFRSIRYSVDPDTGVVSGNKQSDTFFDAGGNVIRQQPAGAMEFQAFTLDSLGRQIKVTDPLNHSTLFAYNEAGNRVSVTDPTGSVHTTRYDAIGRQVETVSPLGQSTSYGYDSAGNQSTVTDGAGETTTTAFDHAGRPLSVTDPTAATTSYVYDAAGNQTSVTDPNGNAPTFAYDHLSRRVKTIDAAGHETETRYNLIGESIAKVDAKGNETLYDYDALGRQITIVDRLNNTTSMAYTVLGQLESLTDAENQVTAYAYDGYGREIEVTWPDHVSGSQSGDAGYGITTTDYDHLDRVLRKTDQLGDTITHSYDVAGRLLQRDYRTKANSPAGTIADSDSFTYDAASRMLTAVSGRYGNTVTYVYDLDGRKLNESLTIDGQTYTTGTQYDAAGRVHRLVYPDGNEITREYTARGQLHKLIAYLTTLEQRGYDSGGRLTSRDYANGVDESRSYNVDNTLANINYVGAPIGDLSYTWDENHNKTSETIAGKMSDYGFTATYDAEDRLVSWNRSDSALDQSWNLSPVGDWNSITENSVLQSRTHGPTHELLTAAGQAVTHDAKGNTTLIPASLRPSPSPLSLTWDQDNRLSSADTDNDGSPDVYYEFDALGRRVARSDSSQTTVYVQNGQQTVADYSSGASPSSPTYTYVWGDYIDELIVRDGGNSRRFYHCTQQYSVTALTDSTGAIKERYAYSAYGTPSFFNGAGVAINASAENNRYMYTGREYDETLSLYHYRARMYDSMSGRFCGKDPIRYADTPNLYGYLVSSLLRNVDPTGLLAPPLAGAVGGCVAGGIYGSISTAISGGGACECKCSGLLGCVMGGVTGAIATTPFAATPLGRCAIGAIAGLIRPSGIGVACNSVCGNSDQPAACVFANMVVQAGLGCASAQTGSPLQPQRVAAEIMVRVIGSQVARQCTGLPPFPGGNPSPEDPYVPVLPEDLPEAERQLCERRCRYEATQVLGTQGPAAAETHFYDCINANCPE